MQSFITVTMTPPLPFLRLYVCETLRVLKRKGSWELSYNKLAIMPKIRVSIQEIAQTRSQFLSQKHS